MVRILICLLRSFLRNSKTYFGLLISIGAIWTTFEFKKSEECKVCSPFIYPPVLFSSRTSFASWMVMNVLLCMVPRYGCYAMLLTGVLILMSNGMYMYLLPRVPLIIHFEVQVLTFHFGWCFWALLVAGKKCLHF